MNKKTKSRIVFGILTLIMMLATLLSLPNISGGMVLAQGQDTCPDSGDWVKIDNLSGFSYNYTAPSGKVVVETCYKAGTTVEYKTINPPKTSVTITTNVQNQLSHVSVRLADEPKEATPRPTNTPTNIPTNTPTNIPTNTPTSIPTNTPTSPPKSPPTSTPTSTPPTSTPTNTPTNTPTFTPTPTPTDETKQDLTDLILVGECDVNQTSKNNLGTISWTVTNNNDEPISFDWDANNGQQGSGNVPANGQTSFQTDGDGSSVSLSYALDQEPVITEASVDVCEPKQSLDDLTLSGECLNDGTIEWTVVNDNDAMIAFNWESSSENGSGQVAAMSQTTFLSSDASSSVTLSYDLNEEALSVSSEVEVCEEEKEEAPKQDPQPDEPAGGSGPSMITFLTPVFFGIVGFALASVLLFNKKFGFVKVR